MKKTYILFALLFCVKTVYGQPEKWDLNKNDQEINVTYKDGFSILFENVGVNKISLDIGGQPDLCLIDGAIKVKLETKLGKEKLILGSCGVNPEIDRTTSFQLKSSNGNRCTVNIRFSDDKPKDNSIGEIPWPYYDALTLKKADAEGVLQVRKKYKIETANANPFLKDIKKDAKISGKLGSVKSIGSALGGLDVTKFADGLAKFLVKRAKEELTIAFFEDFKKELDKHEDIKDLFPNTKATLDLVDKEIYNYERYLVTLRENFEKDFEALPDNITKIVENHAVYFEIHKELASGILVGSKIAIGLRDKDHPGEIISSLEKDEFKGFKPKIAQSLLVVQTFSEAFRDSTTDEKANYWISKKQFQQMAKDTVWLRYFIGLSLEMIKEEDGNLYNALIRKTAFKPFKPTLDSIITQTSRINTLIATHRDDAKVTLETITGYVDAATDLLATADNAVQLLTPDLGDRKFLKNKFIPLIKNSNNLVGNISKEKYGSALFNVIELYKLITPENDNELNNFITTAEPVLVTLKGFNEKKWRNLEILTFYQDVMHLNSDELNKKYEISDASLKSKIEELKKVEYPTDKSVIVWLTKYGGFIAAMLSAESSDEVAAVIETYALPSGSARIKRESYFNISVNSYLGLYGGWDKAHRWSPGVSAPVGVALSWGTKKGAVSVYFQP